MDTLFRKYEVKIEQKRSCFRKARQMIYRLRKSQNVLRNSVNWQYFKERSSSIYHFQTYEPLETAFFKHQIPNAQKSYIILKWSSETVNFPRFQGQLYWSGKLLLFLISYCCKAEICVSSEAENSWVFQILQWNQLIWRAGQLRHLISTWQGFN